MDDYNEKTIFIGIDVHKKTYSVTVVCEGELIKKSTMSADQEGLLKFIVHTKPDLADLDYIDFCKGMGLKIRWFIRLA